MKKQCLGRVLAGLLISSVVVSAIAQDQSVRPSRDKQTEFEKHIAINYMLVDVVVTDRKGNYVRNLTAGDFVIYENGKPVDIESLDEYRMFEPDKMVFEELAEGSLDFSQPPRSIIIFFDLFYASPQGMKRAVEAAEDFVTNRIQPGDKVMVLSYGGSLRTIQTFTNDKLQVIRAMQEVGLAGRRGRLLLQAPESREVDSAREIEESPLNEELRELLEFQADNELYYAQYNARNYILSLQALARASKYYAGRKTLIMLSEGMNFDYIDPSQSQTSRFSSVSRSDTGSMVGPTYPSLYPDYEKMLNLFNDAKVSLYTINVGGLRPITGVEYLNTPTALSSGTPGIININLASRRSRQDFLSSISSETGGRAYFNRNNILDLLNEVEIDISNYYILGYKTEFDPGRSQYRKLKVKVKNPAYKVLHRRGFSTPRPFYTLSREELDLHLAEGFFTRSQLNELDAVVKFQYLRPTPGSMNMTVNVQAPIENLANRNNKFDLEVLVSTVNERGEVFSSEHQTIQISGIDNPDLIEKGLRLVFSLDSDMGSNHASIVIRDNNSGKRSYFFYSYVFREAASDSLIISQPIFFDENNMLRLEDEFRVSVKRIQPKGQKLRGGADFMLHPTKGKMFPVIKPTYKGNEIARFMFIVSNLQLPEDEKPSLTLDFGVTPISTAKGTRSVTRIPVDDLELFRKKGGLEIVFTASFSADLLKPGAYEFFVTVVDKKTGRNAANAGRFLILE